MNELSKTDEKDFYCLNVKSSTFRAQMIFHIAYMLKSGIVKPLSSVIFLRLLKRVLVYIDKKHILIARRHE